MALARARPIAAGEGVAPAAREIGERLRAARLARGEALDEVAAYLRIRPAYLSALEAGDLRATPGGAYLSGFLRTYADHLGLDGRAAIRALAAELAAPTLRALEPPPRWHPPGAAPVGAALILAAGGAIGYALLAPDWLPRPGPETAPPAAAPAPTADAASATAAEVTPLVALRSIDSENAAAVPQGGDGRVVLLGHAPAWLQLRDGDGSFVRARALAAGEGLTPPARPRLAPSTGHAAGIGVLPDARSVGFVGPPGVVVRDLPLDPETLGARSPTR